MNSTEKQLKILQQENHRLKSENKQLLELLNKHNINFNQNKTINHKSIKTNDLKAQKLKERVKIYKSLFKGRNDVYAVRWESKTGQSGYTPACANEWHKQLCKKPAIKCSDCLNRKLLPLTDQVIYDHLSGKKTIGLYPLLQDDTCAFLAVDFDKKNWQQDAKVVVDICKELNIPVSVERSRSGNGCHVWIFFSSPINASLARKLGNKIITHALEKRYQLGMDSFDRFFPSQDKLPQGGFGNLIALPLQHQPRKNGNSVFVDDDFRPYVDQWNYLSSIKKMAPEEVKKCIGAQTQTHLIKEAKQDNISKPEKIEIFVKNGIYIPKLGLSSSLINQFIQLATFNNPEFFKAQSKRLSTRGIPRIIDCSTLTPEHVILPIGCLADFQEICKKNSIALTVTYRSQLGNEIEVEFAGQLNTQQQDALHQLTEHLNGILSATTGFGKTVVAAALIAKRKVKTLVIVHRKQLLNQWKAKLSTFLQIDSSQIGQIGGGKSNPTGCVDIATIQSLYYRGSVKEIVKEYGQVIVDECHHISAFSFEQVLKSVEAKYILGLTATPTRKDGMHPIMKMQCGPIVYKVTAKNQAKIRPFEHILIPRQTRFKSSIPEEQKTIQTLYRDISIDKHRNEIIFNDVLTELDNGSSPLILTERIDHVNELHAMFTGFTKNIIVLTGGLKKKEKEERLRSLEQLSDGKEQLVIATGKYIGEGFDHARLDCLFLAMPISWKGILQQYVGRIHRLHDNKTCVKVYDYIDKNEPMLANMSKRRMKGYASLGYRTQEVKSSEEQMKLF